MASFAVTIGAYELVNFVELNIRSVRDIFGNCPLLIYCGTGRNAGKIKELADRFDAAYITESINRTHFAGCIQSAVAALAFARANECTYTIKQNQRSVMLSPEIPDLLEEVFSNPAIDLAMPRSPRAETILDERSKFHSRFQFSPDIICMRASAIDPKSIADTYAEQVKNDTSRFAALTECYWQRQIETTFKDRFKELEFLREPNGMYLRKCQHSESDYQREAVRLGMPISEFRTEEWSAMLGAAYRPLQAFA